MNITDLPEDILLILVTHLEPKDLLAFCATSQTLHNNYRLRLSSTYWRKATRSTFRVANHPVAANNGRRWMQLYRRMLKDTKVYGWGHNDGGCLGAGEVLQQQHQLHGGPARFNRPFNPHARGMSPRSVTWPVEMKMGDTIGVVADLQCGGWSTTALSQKGQLFTTGVLDGGEYAAAVALPQRLKFPPEFENESYTAATAIRQFSSGRSHILGLSDTGKIWCWNHAHLPGVHIKFLTIDLVEGQDATNKSGKVRQVVAGWNKSSCYVVGKGIYCWEPYNNAELEGRADCSSADGMLVLDAWVVPGTSYLKAFDQDNAIKQDPLAAEIGEVSSWIVLEAFILFVTGKGALYGVRIAQDNEDSTSPSTRPWQLNRNIDLSSKDNYHDHVIDVQGSFRSFAIFKRDGTVLIGDQDYVHSIMGMPGFRDRNDTDHMFHPSEAHPKLRKIPALQNSGVISMAFGDWHSHALHMDGTITSYGHEPNNCGAMGLGGHGIQMTRGIRSINFTDGTLPDEALTTGRRVYFEPEKREWLGWMARGGSENGQIESESRRRLMDRIDVSAEASEWIEDKLRRWELDAPTRSDVPSKRDDDDGLAAHFALSVAAAGWHSGALILVNDEKRRRVEEQYKAQIVTSAQPAAASVWDIMRSFISSISPFQEGQQDHEWIWEQRDETFPRLRLKNGNVLPGSASIVDVPDQLRDWKPIELVDL